MGSSHSPSPPIVLRNVVRSSQRWTTLSLVALFTASFAVPLIAGGLLVSKRALDPREVEEEVFPESVPAQSGGAYLKIDHSEHLEPSDGTDFLLSLWLNFRRIPNAEEQMMLINKVDGGRQPVGFSLSLKRTGNTVRPILFWKNREGFGGTYEFQDLELPPRTWVNFVVTLREGRKLGLHLLVSRPDERPERTLLGGFLLSVPVYPQSMNDLVVGAMNRGTFRGTIGPLLIVKSPIQSGALEELPDILRSMGRNPRKVPNEIPWRDVSLWSVDGRTDRSEKKHSITKSKAIERLLRE